MSRSRKRTPIIPITLAESDKPFKQAEHQRERAAVRAAIGAGEDVPSPRSFGDPAKGPKDGKQYQPADSDRLRK
jgi:hypothetical protein